MHPAWKRGHLNFTMVSRMQLKFPTLALYTVSLPLVSFIFCVVWSLLYNFERATFTHCQVPNYLPSISASIGSFTPQRHIWQICVAIHSAPRFLVVAMYYSHLCDILFKSALWQWIALIIFLLQATEVTSLLGLTFVSSSENFHVHELCFITFMVSALFNMLFLYLAMKNGVKHRLSPLERTSLRYKLVFGLTNITAFLLAVYFYLRHNKYCEPTVYTYFAFFEYIVVISNMAYHMTAYWDFCDHLISVSSCCSLSVTSQQKAKYFMNDFIVKIA